MCENGVNANSISFHGQQCGIHFSNKNWKSQQTVNVTGTVDNMVNYEDRVSALRLYHDAEKVNVTIDELAFWIGVTLKDIKVSFDKDLEETTDKCRYVCPYNISLDYLSYPMSPSLPS